MAVHTIDATTQGDASALIDPQQVSVPCFFMRGGSSRGGFFLNTDLPTDVRKRDALLLGIYGSPDTRQIDGLGGSDPLTSKAAIVAGSSRADADLEYTFCQVSVERAKVSTGGNCGNMLSGVVPFGILRGLISAHEGENQFRVYTTNTGQTVTITVSVRGGFPCVSGNTAIAGVPWTGSRIGIDFGDCAGAVSGKLLPTGNATDVIDVFGQRVAVSLVDAATPFVFVVANDLGVDGTQSADQIRQDEGLLARLESVRGWAARILGLVDDASRAQAITPNIPRVIMVAPPRDYRTPNGEVHAEEIDLCVRQLSMQKPHKALAVTGSVCTAVASQLAGTTVQQCKRATAGGDLRLGHPSGVLHVSSTVEVINGEPVIRRAVIERTARLIMAGQVYVEREKLEHLLEILE